MFALLSLQAGMSFIQVRRYQKTVQRWLGKGIVGVGQRKGILKKGELLIVVYKRCEDRVLSVQSMKGRTVFSSFCEASEYTGLSLNALRHIAIEKDALEMKWRRKRYPYDPTIQSKQKGALIQAVEAIDRYLQKQKEKEEDNHLHT